jgi:hypothetical protein
MVKPGVFISSDSVFILSESVSVFSESVSTFLGCVFILSDCGSAFSDNVSVFSFSRRAKPNQGKTASWFLSLRACPAICFIRVLCAHLLAQARSQAFG